MRAEEFREFAKDPSNSDDAVKEAFLDTVVGTIEDMGIAVDALRQYRCELHDGIEQRMIVRSHRRSPS